MCLQKCKLKILKKKYQEKWEKSYLTVKNATASGALCMPQIPSLQTNVSANYTKGTNKTLILRKEKWPESLY